MYGVKTFKTTCADISLGGMKLKHPLPPSMLSVKCKVSIAGSDPKDSIMFHCKVIADSVVPWRICFSETDTTSQKKLEHWLESRRQLNGD